MKNIFKGYYHPSEADFKKIWKEGLIVLDTNVLLNLYRLPAEARKEFLDVLNILKSRLWIPFQVGLEFQRRRLTVISSERKNIESVLDQSRQVLKELAQKVKALELEKRGIDINPSQLLKDIESANTNLQKALEKAHASQIDISSTDSLRDSIDDLFADRVGSGPKNQEELDSLTVEGDKRYSKKYPLVFLI